ncbi:NAD(P)H-nitrite reductase large subunit [Arthrobacter sp. MP_M7]|nr:NAD(P)H-nitrite reductase large subunit [Arthrobacter sp. MP_M4]MEC5201754.1 NAD(P)H-nitrite reductase large subunit [Arthrobacter sp. MP_M7]
MTEQTSSPHHQGAEPAAAPHRIVVAGGGPAAHRFADAMHARGLEGWDVTVLTEEAHPPYDRVALSKAFTDAAVDLTLGASLWDHEFLTLQTGERVTGIDIAAKTVTTAAGTRYPYDDLVVATGSAAIRLPIPGAEHTHVYRTLEDVRAINLAIRELTQTLGRTVNAVTIGGGLLGLEAAAGTEQLGAAPIVINGSPWLMNTQLDEGAGQALGRLIRARGFTVHTGVRPSEILSNGDGQVTGVLMADGRVIAADLVIVAIGVRPRDELFHAANDAAGPNDDQPFPLGPRGGVVISEDCQTQVPGVWAIGEVANFDGMCLGLVAPANTMAEIVADRLHGGGARFPGFDTATKLKLSGVDVASFGDAFAATEHALEIVYADPARGVYQKIVTTDDAKTLLGGIFVGDATPYTSLRPLLGRPLAAEPGAYLTAAGGDAPDTDLPDDAVLCSCNNVAAGSIRDAVNGCGACAGNTPVRDLGELKACTRAGTQCGSCVPMLKKLLEGELTKSGVAVSKSLCEHFDLSRQELFDAIRVLDLSSFEDMDRDRLRHLQAHHREHPGQPEQRLRARRRPRHPAGHQRPRPGQHAKGRHLFGGPADRGRRNHTEEARRDCRRRRKVQPLHQDHWRPADRHVRRQAGAAPGDLEGTGGRRLRIRPGVRQVPADC